MSLFKLSNSKLLPIKEKKILLEKDIQALTENNLDSVFGYTFVSTELKIETFRFDTLAWDSEKNSFVIIEYKKDRNFSVVDQGFAYLSVLLNRKADFILEYNNKFPNKQLKREDVDWSQSRVIFIAPYFTSYQINSINFRNMPFDLYEFNLYENNTVAYSKIEANNPTESINTVVKSGEIEKISKEIKSYTIEEHFNEGWEKSRELFDIINAKILELDPNFSVIPTKQYIGYKLGSKLVLHIEAQKSGLMLKISRFMPKDLNDPEGRLAYIENSMKFWNVHTSYMKISLEDDIDYAMMLAKQVYKKFIENN